MKGIPEKTGDFLKDAVRGFPRTPYAGAKAIQKFMFVNYRYGCDENIIQDKWARYPDEVKKFMTCQDAGIFNYLMAKQIGLDVVLAKFDDFNGTDQSHLGALICSDNGYYLLSNYDLEKICLKENKYFSLGRKVKNAVKISLNELKSEDLRETLENAIPQDMEPVREILSFSKVSFLDVADVANMMEFSRGREGFMNFFATGQMTSTYYNRLKNIERKVYSANRFFRINNNFMELRKSFDFAGYLINLLFAEDKLEIVFSSGINNSVMINPVIIYGTDCNETNRYSKTFQDMNYVEQPDEIKLKIENTWVRRRIGLKSAEYFMKKERKTPLEKLNEAIGEKDLTKSKIYSKSQLKLAYLHAEIAAYTGWVPENSVQKYKENQGFAQLKPYTYSHLMIGDYIDAQTADTKSSFFRYHKELVNKVNILGLEYGLKP